MGLKRRFFLGSVLVLVCVLALFSANSHSSIVGSKHDLSASGTSGWSGTLNSSLQVCVYCHTPHNANSNVRTDTKLVNGSGISVGSGTQVLLWNRNLPASTSFTAYSSSTLNNAPISEIRVYSLLCLSCHDGIGAMNVMTQPPSDGIDISDPGMNNIGDLFTGSPPFGWGPNIGELTGPGTINLSNDHPISLDYPTSDSSFQPKNNVTTAGLVLHPSPTLGPDYSIECSTCHDVHEEGSEVTGTYPFLRVHNNNSNLCLTCHIK